jgi:hypothetical protein
VSLVPTRQCSEGCRGGACLASHVGALCVFAAESGRALLVVGAPQCTRAWRLLCDVSVAPHGMHCVSEGAINPPSFPGRSTLKELSLPAPLPISLAPHAATAASQGVFLMCSPPRHCMEQLSHQYGAGAGPGKPKALRMPRFERQQQPAQVGGQLRTSAAAGARPHTLSQPWMTCPSSA